MYHCLAENCCRADAGKAVLLCQSSKKEFYKKFLYEPLPVEVNKICSVLCLNVGYKLYHVLTLLHFCSKK